MDKKPKLSRLFFQIKKKPNSKKVTVLGIPVLSKTIKNYTEKKSFLGFPYKSTFLFEKFLNDQRPPEPPVIEIKPPFNGLRPHATLMDYLGEAFSAYHLHQKNFLPYKNIHQGKDVVLVATGPTLEQYTPIENAVHIGVNKAFTFDKVKFDLLFLQDIGGSRSYIEEFCAYDADKFIGILSSIYPPSIISESIVARHKGIKRYYAAHPGELSRPVYDISTSALWDAYSIAFPVMQFILWTNPKRIYLVGCDCSQGYWDNKSSDHSATHMIEGWKELKKFADIFYPETEIISINPVGLRGLFQDMDT